MKRLTSIFIVLHVLLYIHVIAQKNGTMQIYKGSQVINTINLTDIDSIKLTLCYSNCGKVKDYDGNIYTTVIIGTQCWMQQNLNTTHYNNGVPIPNVTDSTMWWNLTTAAYCNYENNSIYSLTYGRMYNGYIIDSNKLCPNGWHVPADTEWTKLIVYLGDTNVAGGKMKEAGTAHWTSPNGGATNSSGFTALPGGYRDATYYDFGSLGLYTAFWATNKEATFLWFINLGYSDSSLNKGWYDIHEGLNVRCVKGN